MTRAWGAARPCKGLRVPNGSSGGQQDGHGPAARRYKGLRVPNVSFGTVEKAFWAWKAQQGEQQGAARLGSRVATVQQW